MAFSPREATDHIRRAIALVNDAADGTGDQDITPSEIAEAVRDALEMSSDDMPPKARRYLTEALDSVSDGMPSDHVAMSLYAALGVIQDK